MGWKAAYAVRMSGLKGKTKTDVLEALAAMLNEKNGDCFPSTETIAKVARVSPNVVRPTLKELEEEGLIATLQKPGCVRHFRLFLNRLPEPLLKPEGVTESEPLTKPLPLTKLEGVTKLLGDPSQNNEGTPNETVRGPLTKLVPELGKELGIELGKELVSSVRSSTGFKSEPSEGSEVNPEGVQKCTLTGFRSEPQKRKETGKEIGKKQEECVHAQEPLPPPPTDSDLEAMCAQYDGDLSNGAVEPVSEKPRAKTKKIREPLVPLPETLPDDWRALAKERRPEIDPDALLRKMRVRYGPLVKKTMTNWKRTFLNWIARERYYPAPQWQQRRDNRPLQREDMTYTDDF